MVTLFATLKVHPGQESLMKEIIIELAQAVRENEPGCTMYIPHVSTTDPTEITVAEKYVDQAALDSHEKSAHFRAAAKKFIPLLREEPLKLFLEELV